MKEFKFRAFDKESSQMIYCKDSYKNDLGEFYFDFDGRLVLILSDADSERPAEIRDAEIMEFTGLYDKNGKEIYEGDIVRTWANPKDYGGYKGHDYIAAVEWNDDWHGFMLSDGHGLTDFDNIEVLGNIYQNSDLLENKVDS